MTIHRNLQRSQVQQGHTDTSATGSHRYKCNRVASYKVQQVIGVQQQVANPFLTICFSKPEYRICSWILKEIQVQQGRLIQGATSHTDTKTIRVAQIQGAIDIGELTRKNEQPSYGH